MSCQDERFSSSCVGIMDRALALERGGVDVIHLEKGEADLDTPEVIKERAVRAIRDNETRYTSSAGLPELRQAICDHHERTDGVRVPPSRVFVTSGSSPALLTLFLALLGPGDEVILADPSYPAYPKVAQVAGARPVHVPTVETGFALTARAVAGAISPTTRAIVVNSPSNPAGAVIPEDELRAIAKLGPLVVSDEAYAGLTFDGSRAPSILSLTDEAAVVGTFSKAFNMTGWRLGYSIVPERLAGRVKEYQEHFFVSPNAFVQWAGIAALAEMEPLVAATRAELRSRRDCLLAGLGKVGFEVPVVPRGGPYVLARLPGHLLPAARFASDLLEVAHVAVTPGGEFGPGTGGYVRFSCAAGCSRIEEAMERLGAFVRARELTEVAP